MKFSHFASVGSAVLASAVLCYAWGGHGTGHMGGGTGHTMSSSHGSQSSHSTQSTTQTQSSTSTPKPLQDPNSKLSTNLQKLLPAGTTPQQACSGFKNLGRCVAAIHVSHNLGLSFTDLKAKMTGSNAESLGKAIQDLKPSADSKTETKKANKQAQNDMNESQS